MSAADKIKLNGIAAGAQVNPGNATSAAAGLMSAADKIKLDGLSDSSLFNLGTFRDTRTIASVITEFGAAHPSSNNMTGVANFNQSNPPADIPANAFEWKYGTALVMCRYINSNGIVNYGNIIVFGYQINKIAIASIMDNSLMTWKIFSGDEATTAVAGLMSAADKTKLNGITANAKTITRAYVDITTNNYGFAITNVSSDLNICGAYCEVGGVMYWPYQGSWVFAIVDVSTGDSSIIKVPNHQFRVYYDYYS
jgi:hypothetical protein